MVSVLFSSSLSRMKCDNVVQLLVGEFAIHVGFHHGLALESAAVYKCCLGGGIRQDADTSELEVFVIFLLVFG